VIDFVSLAQQCAPDVHYDTMRRIAHVESSFNPFAIGVVADQLERQPRSHAEAIATAKRLEREGRNYSVGLMQINMKNFRQYGLTLETAFEPCRNVGAAGQILKDCFARARESARASDSGEQGALRAAISCYYSGNFTTGFKHGYVTKVVAAGAAPQNLTVPMIATGGPADGPGAAPSATAATPPAEGAVHHSSEPTQSALLF
jgi:type IV secretion system protein VirB1